MSRTLISFITPASNRKLKLASSWVEGAYSVAASLNSKRRHVHAIVPMATDIEQLKVKLKNIGCTKIELI